jgi:hypothetical protein
VYQTYSLAYMEFQIKKKKKLEVLNVKHNDTLKKMLNWVGQVSQKMVQFVP